MDLRILISKKGTKIVTASNLHKALDLPNSAYAKNVKKWLSDLYEFRDGIRKPESRKDFSKRVVKHSVVDDYYISVELAKMIALSSRSKVKQKYAKWLCSLEDKVENAELITKDQVETVLELSKVMGLVSCQAATEQKHLQTYESRNNGQANNWWKYRSALVGYSLDKLKDAVRKLGHSPKGKSQRQLLMMIDRYEMIRTSVIDLFMAMGKSERYARNMGDLAKLFAKELKVEIYDDRNTNGAFAPAVNPKLLNEIKGIEQGEYLSVWN